MLVVLVLLASPFLAALANTTGAQPGFTGGNFTNGSVVTGGSNCFKASLRNLALQKNVSQSSTYPGFEAHRASNAVDGIRQAHWVAPYCAHTNAELNPYWFVDLGEDHVIERIEVVNRVGFEERFRDISVVVAGYNGKYDQTCGHYKGPAKGIPVVTIRCSANTCGRYVKIQQATNPPEYLTLCEVEVYGY